VTREKTLSKIKVYKIIAERRKFLKKEKLLSMKVSLATKLLNEQRKGSSALCKPSRSK